MRKKKRRWSRNLAKLVIGLRNAWGTELPVFKSQTVWAHHPVFLYLGSSVGQPTWKGRSWILIGDANWCFYNFIWYVLDLIAILTGWWRHRLLVILLVWTSWEAEECLRSMLNTQLSETWMYGGPNCLVTVNPVIPWTIFIDSLILTCRLHTRATRMMKMLWEQSIFYMTQLWFLVVLRWVSLSLCISMHLLKLP